ncbi:uncharacterized protein LOC113565139 isoform X2 [Drosophila persimilis]|uniref:uncharacterized protein LOC113565139 isoform X2 n=1 Tax=Drosophila persimilis TaxID=7234 RepID=UPI000F099875|nr:uncharacterized protein LOC113565139 isoform X2 [Drosophila persimilis]
MYVPPRCIHYRHRLASCTMLYPIDFHRLFQEYLLRARGHRYAHHRLPARSPFWPSGSYAESNARDEGLTYVPNDLPQTDPIPPVM